MHTKDRDGEANIGYEITDIKGDMEQSTRLGFIHQTDGDVILSLLDSETGQKLSIEFCTISSGGRSPIVLKGLQSMISQFVEENEKKDVNINPH